MMVGVGLGKMARTLQGVDTWRWLRHWFHAPASRAFPPAAMQRIQDAITQGEVKHDGEICFVVEARLPTRYLIGGRRVRARAESVFGDLKVWDTERRTGVLIYVLLGDYTIEVIPDRGVKSRVPEGSWERIVGFMSEQFRNEQWEAGALAGIEATHNLLELYLPPGPGRQTALPNPAVVL
ncbi:MAG: hypothetical protein EPN36_12280 [Rhodanobacteraceae bacterium]|nr:MAG: hypothetical protein EPN36_12280 [Rhodanobacteraceae bacterium]